MRRPKDKLIAGMDLHSNNVVIGVINQDGKRVAHRKVECDLEQVTQFLEPLKPQLQSMAVESTFNWYWLVDGLRAAEYPIDLANPAKIEQYNGLKHADDKDDAFYLAELQRLDILPKAYVYDPALRPVRDLLRRRGRVHQRTTLLLRAANYARRFDEHCRRWYDRKAAKTSKVIATKALGCKLAKAAWHVMVGQCDYDEKRMFPELATKAMKTS